jgi:hypothetical protein
MSTLTAGAGAPAVEEAGEADAGDAEELAAGADAAGAAEPDAADAEPPLAGDFVCGAAAAENAASGSPRHTRLRTMVTRRRIAVSLLIERRLR